MYGIATVVPTPWLLYVLVKAWVRVLYGIYKHEGAVESLKIEHEAEG